MILSQGHPARRTFDGILARIDALNADIQATEHAPIPHSETRERISKALENLWVPDHLFRRFAEPNARGIHLPTDPKDSALSIIALLFGKAELLERIMSNAIACDTRPVGLPAAERERRLVELRAQVAHAWREAEIEALRIEEESDGADEVDRRADADPDVLLQVWGERGPAIRSSGSSASGPQSPRPFSDLGHHLNSGTATSAAADSGVLSDDMAAGAIEGDTVIAANAPSRPNRRQSMRLPSPEEIARHVGVDRFGSADGELGE